jgi:Ni,Fe-hydrogenase III small subunit
MAWKLIARALLGGHGTEAEAPPDEIEAHALAARLHAASQRLLGRGLAIRQVDSGSCNGCELEIQLLGSIVYDLERFGLRFVASPRHADVLLVTGPVTRNMHEALLRTWTATPDPKFVIGVGDCAIDGGVFKGSPAISGGIDEVLKVDAYVRGCPPTPTAMLEVLCALVEANVAEPGRSRRG